MTLRASCAMIASSLVLTAVSHVSAVTAASMRQDSAAMAALRADSLRREVGALAAQGRLDEAQALVARSADAIPDAWRSMFAGKLELDGETSAQGYSEAATDSSPEQMRGEATYRIGQYHYAAGRYNLAIPQFRLYLANHPDGPWAEASAYWMAHSCLLFARSRSDRAAYLDTAEAYLSRLESKGRRSYYWPLARAARARVLLERGDSVSLAGAARALRDARGGVPPEEAAGVLLLSLQAQPDAPDAGNWEDSLRWDYPLSPEARALEKPKPRAPVAAAPRAPAVSRPPEDSARTPMPMVVPPPRLPPIPPSLASNGSSGSAARGKYALQVGAFAQRENAERMRAELAAKKVEARIAPLTTSGKTLFRVLAGSYPDAETAQREGQKIGYPFRVVEN
jgi:cell division septation protein DedD